jgi:hypothetical protein
MWNALERLKAGRVEGYCHWVAVVVPEERRGTI